jgi:4-hydroxythreonine-4-phosphate dehydrogenase
MLGPEEERALRPGLDLAREQLREQGLGQATLEGPLPADAIFVAPGRWDAVLCCYHDQALIPLKLLHRDEAVNITLGLPIVRTSPAHGTALDIAGRGVAREGSMLAALDLASQVARRRGTMRRESSQTLRIS